MAKQETVNVLQKIKIPPPPPFKQAEFSAFNKAKPVAKSPLFGLGTISTSRFAMEYRSWCYQRSNKKIKIAYVTDRLPKKTHDIYIIETVSVFIRVKNHLPDGSVAVISDSPLLLNEVPDIRPLDYDKKESWRFMFHPVRYADFDRARLACKNKPVKDFFKNSKLTKIDRLGVVIESAATGLVLTNINAFIRPLSFACRAQARSIFTSYLIEMIEKDKITTDLEGALKDCIITFGENLPQTNESLEKLIAGIKKHRQLLSTGLRLYFSGKNIKKLPIEPYELRYLGALVRAKRPDMRATLTDKAKADRASKTATKTAAKASTKVSTKTVAKKKAAK